MTREDADLLLDLLEGVRVLSLGVLVEGAPYLGLVPFVPKADRTALYVHTSSLARHSRGLRDGAPFSALVHAADVPEADPLQVPRLTLVGTVRPLASREETEAAAAREAYLRRFPGAAQTFALADFALHALEIASGRLVGGFARARDVSRQELAQLSGR